MQRLGVVLLGKCRAPLDKRPTNPAPLLGWFHKQAVEIDVAVGPDQNRGEANHSGANLCHKHETRRELIGGDFDRVRIGKECLTIARIVERSSPLQCFECVALTFHTRTNQEAPIRCIVYRHAHPPFESSTRRSCWASLTICLTCSTAAWSSAARGGALPARRHRRV